MPAQPMSDLDVYRRLSAMATELEALSVRTATLVGGTALSTAAATLKGTATAVYAHCLATDPGGTPTA